MITVGPGMTATYQHIFPRPARHRNLVSVGGCMAELGKAMVRASSAARLAERPVVCKRGAISAISQASNGVGGYDFEHIPELSRSNGAEIHVPVAPAAIVLTGCHPLSAPARIPRTKRR